MSDPKSGPSNTAASVRVTTTKAALDALAAERDRYREALEAIYRQGKGVHVEIAREALNRG